MIVPPFRRALVACCLAVFASAPFGAGAFGQEAKAAPVDPCAPVAPLEIGFEDGTEGWQLREAAVDDAVARGGKRSLRLTHGSDDGFAMAGSSLPFERARGRRVRLSGWIRTEDVTGSYAGLWLRVDRGREMVSLDNMSDRGLRGTVDWTPVELVADVPVDATGVVFGAILPGQGTSWVDDLTVTFSPIVPAVPVAIRGRVERPDGTPAAGATVAVVRFGAPKPAAVAVAGADGGFGARVLPGRYAVTATDPGFAPAFVVPVVAREGLEVPVTLGPAGGGFALAGQVRDSSGAAVGGAQVRCVRMSEVEGDVFLTGADAEGRYALRLLEAPHACTAEADGQPSATVEVAPGTARQDLTIWRPAPAPGAVVDWIRGAAVPLLTPQAGHGFADMAPLAGLVGDARVVALGEATHGSREIFQMKHRMLEYLVAELGFTVFAIEANWPESEAVNHYVLTGEGDPAEALAGLYFWTWNTEEVLDLIRWMRQWNAVADNPKVEFYGFDMQTATVAGKELARVLGEIDRTLAGELEPLLPLLEPRREPAGTAEQRTGLAALLGRIGERFASPPPALAGRELLVARQYVRVIEQYLERTSDAGGGYAVRDRAMADNTRWIADVAKPGARIVLWAHNGHVHDAQTFIPWMGSHLEAALGDAYLPVGFLFHHGSFQAIDGTGGKAGLKEFSLGAPAAGTLEDTFARAGWPIAVLDLRRLPPGPVTDWFGQPQRMRETGALFSDEENMTNARVLPDDFEAVIYLESTTRARPNPRRAPPVSE